MHVTLLAIEAASICGDMPQLTALLNESGLTEEKARILLQAYKAKTWEGVRQLLPTLSALSFEERIQAISAHFLGAPYHYVVDILVPWHEPATAYDFSLRVDAFDCMSLVEMVLGISQLPSDWEEHALQAIFQQWMFPQGATPSPLTRHRFIDAEWAPHNYPLIQEITAALPLPIAYQRRTLDKASLIQKQLEVVVPGSRYYASFSPDIRKQIAEEASHYSAKEVSTAYVAIADVIEQYDALIAYFTHHSHGALIATVISDSPMLLSRIGSDYNVTHLGFLFLKDNRLILRHATSVEPHAVVDVDLHTYALKRLASQKAREGIGELAGGKVKGFGFYAVHPAL
jgi:hypothetical protein